MNLNQGIVAVASAIAGGLCAWTVLPWALRRAPASLMRTNVRGRGVPAVLGAPLVAGAAFSLAVVVLAQSLLDVQLVGIGMTVALGLLLVVLGGAGLVDDLRGDEPDRGFGGHLRAVAGGRLTGGTVKLAAGGVGGIMAAALLGGTTAQLVAVVLAVPLGANTLNLLDRAPGRALKAGLLLGAVAVVVAPGGWTVAAAGMLGAAVVCVAPDLRERGMLGDAGANPLGAIAALGVVLGLPSALGLAFVVLLGFGNAASERVSFSSVIERSRWLGALDRWGRA